MISIRKINNILLLPLSIVLLLYWLVRLKEGIFRVYDSDEYVHLAQSIQSGQWFHRTHTIIQAIDYTKRTPLYSLFLLAMGMAPDAIIALVQAGIALITLYFTFRIFSKKSNWASGWFLAILLLFTPSIFIYSGLVLSEIWVAFLFTLLAFILTAGKAKTRQIWLVQIILCLLCLTKPVFYPFTVINLGFWGIFFIKKKKSSAFSAIIPLLLVIAYMGYNDYRTGYFHYSSIQTINLSDYNVYYFLIHKEGEEKATLWKDSLHSSVAHYTDFAAYNRTINKECQQVIHANIFSYFKFHLWGAIRGMFDPGHFDIYTILPPSSQNKSFLIQLNKVGMIKTLQGTSGRELFIMLSLLPIFAFLLLKWFLVFIYVWKKRHTASFESIFLIILVGYVILATGPLNASRFMMPFQPFICCIAALSFLECKRMLKYERVALLQSGQT